MNAICRDIFIISSEKKDKYCLDPIASGLSVINDVNHVENVYDPEFIDRFCRSQFPVAVFASHWVLKYLSIIRPRITFIAINIEHGLAPFKKYTFGPHLVEADCYIAPTQLWAERLRKIYPDHSKKIIVGGFPKLEILQEMRASMLSLSDASGYCDRTLEKWRQSGGTRKLVILSWGTNSEALDRLPDKKNILYLYHPADASGLKSRKSNNCTMILSTPKLANYVLCFADKVFGDFSSLTLEAMAMGINTSIFVDRGLYTSNCDLDESFFDRNSDKFGLIPETPHHLDKKSVMDSQALAAALSDDANASATFPTLELPKDIFPPAGQNNVRLTVDAILNFISKFHDIFEYDGASERIANSLFILDAYQKVLARTPDLEGFKHYLTKIEGSNLPKSLIGIQIINAMANSEEGRKTISDQYHDFPLIQFH